MTEAFWEEMYQARDRVWSGKPNGFLVDVVEPLPPGTALDLGCAEGADAVWLAKQGWKVTAVDVSPTALRRAAAAAEGLAIVFEQHDLGETFPEGTYDLVSAQFLQSPVEFPRERVLRQAADAVAPGGLLLIVEHASVPPWSGMSGDVRLPTAAETLAALELADGEWTVERMDAPEREVTGPEGRTATVSDNVIAARRVNSRP
ncbi:class I SAM-dependent methyltransferase [Umezawaea sp. Da 62-37]|uniref:class I SAM-dependent methyltransferase n=1 Tax=Umezawaea sp. Da 62-37 TaxID=3075927 RepID=UPI0028F6EBC5|nr:class I SAM-dependent methyltransferase [Umezawaea sp. Da 62-37]WNV89211.1 class I SAM-dependent methyltransferase [Umezawaea sp. Da 62-37]